MECKICAVNISVVLKVNIFANCQFHALEYLGILYDDNSGFSQKL